jgi:hypothetical protein
MKDMMALDKTQRTDVENKIIKIHTHSYLVEVLAMDVGAVLLCVHVVAQPQPHVRLRGSTSVHSTHSKGVCSTDLRLYTSTNSLKQVYTSPEVIY